MKLINSILAVALLGVSLPTQSQSYPQKLAALQERVRLDTGYFLPEIEKAAAVERLYALVFQSNADPYFDRDNGLIRTIYFKQIFRENPTREEVAGITRIKGHVLAYPVNYDSNSMILERLEEEANILADIPGILQNLQTLVPNMNITFERDVLYGATNSNVTRLQMLQQLQNVLRNNPAVLDRIQNYKRFEVIDTIDNTQSNQIDLWMDGSGAHSQKYASLKWGRRGLYTESLFFNEALLEATLKIAFLDGFGIKSSYDMKASDFALGLEALQSYLLSSGRGPELLGKGVEGFELDPGYQSRERLFSNGILTVGITQESILQVISLFFP